MKRIVCAAFAGLFALPVALIAQQGSQPAAAAPANPITMSEKGLYLYISGNVVAAAEKMPEENYSFKPSPDVRSFGQLVGHVADANYMFCSLAAGEANPNKNVEKTVTSKAELVAAVKDAVSYCSKAFDGMNDAKGGEIIKLFGTMKLARLTVFSLNTAHTDEHYGNIVTYMRLKGLVPPSSAQAPPPPQK